MSTACRIPFLKPVRYSKILFLFLTWILGLTIGYIRGMQVGNTVSAYFSVAGHFYVSAFALAVSVLLPLIISALAAFFIPFALYPIAFMKAFLYGLSIACLRVAFGSASWLMLILLTFTETISIPFYLCFWSSLLRQGRDALHRNLLITATAAVLAAAVDYYVISPFLFEVACYI